jgi:trehalose-6-phosphate synthase
MRVRFTSATAHKVGQHSTGVDTLYKQYDPEVLVAYFLAADVALVTPLMDGMNLVAKEYVATRANDGGALILRQLAGAAVELKDALLINLYDIDEIVRLLKYALELDRGEQRHRVQALGAAVHKNTLSQWSQAFSPALYTAQMSRTSLPSSGHSNEIKLA